MEQPSPISSESLGIIVRLLNLYPDVRAADAMVALDENGIEHVHIRFRCTSFSSLQSINNCATYANAGRFYVVDASFRSRYDTDGDEMWFFMDIEDDWNEGEPPRRSEIFGIFLARHLKSLGLIAGDESDGIQESWNAIPL